MDNKKIDPSTFVFRNTTVGKFLKNMEAKNKPSEKKPKTTGIAEIYKKPKATGIAEIYKKSK